jgi:hypothetical protein
MDETGSRLLTIGLIVAGFILFNHFAQRAAKRLREQREAAEREAAGAAPEEQEELEDVWGRPVPPPPPPVETAPAPHVLPAAPPPARAPHPLFRTPQDLRRAIVAMTVLGPCRAQEPPEQR